MMDSRIPSSGDDGLQRCWITRWECGVQHLRVAAVHMEVIARQIDLHHKRAIVPINGAGAHWD
jgi:hypothetical protein